MLVYLYNVIIYCFVFTDFTNPPTNLQCKVRFRGQYDSRPLVEMRWELPDFLVLDGLRTNEYTIFSTNGINFVKPVRFDLTDMTFYTEIYEELEGINDIETTEELYKFSVSVDVGGGYRSAPAVCDINLIERGICICIYTLLLSKWDIRISQVNTSTPVCPLLVIGIGMPYILLGGGAIAIAIVIQ